MNVRVFNRSALSIAAAIVTLTGCGGGSGSTSVAPSLPVAAQFNLTFVNSVVYVSTPSGVSFEVADSASNCIKFPEPFSDSQLDYGDSATRTIWLVDCGRPGWFTVTFHALNVSLADTTVKWTVSESGLGESIVDQGGLCIKPVKGAQFKDSITAKPASGCY
jgi:hypothetical protein